VGGGSDAEGVAQLTESEGELSLDVTMAALLDTILNGGVECGRSLRNVFADFSCSLSSSCTLPAIRKHLSL
jgi:hypothetical protein